MIPAKVTWSRKYGYEDIEHFRQIFVSSFSSTRARAMATEIVFVAGLSLLAAGLLLWRSADPPRYLVHFILALFVSTLKGRLPGITGTVSFGFVFVLIGVAEFSFSETIAIASATGLVQCVWKARRRPIVLQSYSNLATLVISAAAAYSDTLVYPACSSLRVVGHSVSAGCHYLLFDLITFLVLIG
jgi:hypothetical protein